MTRLIFVNRYFYPDHSATSQMLPDLAFALANDGGLDIHVITSRQRFFRAQVLKVPESSISREPIPSRGIPKLYARSSSSDGDQSSHKGYETPLSNLAALGTDQGWHQNPVLRDV